MDEGTIAAYLKRKGLTFEKTGGEFKVKNCPMCESEQPGATRKVSNQWKLYIQRSTGLFLCHRCGSQGNYFGFKAKLGDGGSLGVAAPAADATSSSSSPFSPSDTATSSSSSSSPSSSFLDSSFDTAAPTVPLSSIRKANTALFEDPAFSDVLDYLTTTRGLSKPVLREYLVGASSRPFRSDDSDGWVHQNCISMPWISRESDDQAPLSPPDTTTSPSDDSADGEAAAAGGSTSPSLASPDEQLIGRRVKYRSVVEKSNQGMEPRGGRKGMFGMHLVPSDVKSIVITEGEFDAMAVRQETGAYAVSLPNGARSLPVELLPWLERFERIYLWLDDDLAGREGCEKLISKLGVGRCLIVRPTKELSAGKPPAKDANDALRNGYDLCALLDAARPQPHEQILTFNDLRADVYQELHDPDRVVGTPYRWLPSLQQALKGHRLGELTILTGATGSGKTTLLSQLSLDLCDQGIPTLWGSFEIKNVRLVKRMMMQLHGGNLDGAEDDVLDRVSERLVDLPMYFLKFFGSTDVDEVLDAMEFAAYVYDVEHIVLDNLQFMLGTSGGRGFERFDSQERALDKFRQFASNHNVHVTLVVHPRKEDENVRLGLSSVFGTAKATQEADNVLVVQAMDGSKFIDIKKNRFDGTAGQIPIKYDTESQRFVETLPGSELAMPSSAEWSSRRTIVTEEVVMDGAGAGAGAGRAMQPFASRRDRFRVPSAPITPPPSSSPAPSTVAAASTFASSTSAPSSSPSSQLQGTWNAPADTATAPPKKARKAATNKGKGVKAVDSAATPTEQKPFVPSPGDIIME